MNWLLKGIAGAIFPLLTSCSPSPAATQHVFVTDYGLGPDKWATAWLLTHQSIPGSRLKVTQAGQPLPDGTAFDLPSSPIRRQGDRAAFQVARDAYALTDPDVARLAQIVHDIEVDFWGSERDPASPIVEQAFRSLQQRYGREAVTPECYVAFFGSVHAAIGAQRKTGKPLAPGDLLADCRTALAPSASAALVPEVPVSDLLAEMGRGKAVIFVDVRESDEFAEGHIPGARNISLRHVNPEVVSQLQHADYVVSYCVKDFRGFEMAKALRDAGVHNSVILNPYGIKGWVSQGLPTAGTRAMSEPAARAILAACTASPDQCITATTKH